MAILRTKAKSCLACFQIEPDVDPLLDYHGGSSGNTLYIRPTVPKDQKYTQTQELAGTHDGARHTQVAQLL